ncbi:MAG: PepSY domain-containing protein [Pseudomonadota bacterium]
MGRLNRPMLLVIALLTVGWQGIQPALAGNHNEAYELRKSGKILPLEQILKQNRGEARGKVLEVELERKRGAYVYEVLMLDQKGEVWEIYFDAQSGKMLSKHRED